MKASYTKQEYNYVDAKKKNAIGITKGAFLAGWVNRWKLETDLREQSPTPPPVAHELGLVEPISEPLPCWPGASLLSLVASFIASFFSLLGFVLVLTWAYTSLHERREEASELFPRVFKIGQSYRAKVKGSSRGERRIFYPTSRLILFDPGEQPPVQLILAVRVPGA